VTERFSTPRTNVIESDQGFSVEVLGQTGMFYAEVERSLHLYSEVAGTIDAIAIWRDSIKRWDPPHDGETIGTEERERIIGNIQRAFEATNKKLDVI
jgi:hypothetical protein